MEAALRRRLEGVSRIAISQEQQTAEVAFGAAAVAFAPEEFRAAVGEADVEVLTFHIELCGLSQSGAAGALGAGAPGAQGALGAQGAGAPGASGAPGAPGVRWFIAGPNQFVINDDSWRVEGRACVSATLDDRLTPPGLVDIRRVR
jgi:hypothetical protein